jgi:hypothetical protein
MDQALAVGQVDSVVNQTFRTHARAEFQTLEQLRRGLFENAGTYPPEHILGRSALENDDVALSLAKQMTEQQTRWPSADDRHLGFHGSSIVSS